MPPLDMQTHGASGESCMNSSSSSLRSLVDAAASTLGGPEDTAGERRRERALKLRQARTRNANNANANAARGQVYTSAEDSDDEVEEEDVKPDISGYRDEAPADGTDKQAWKKQQRMIRNRESAALSRKRKRDRIESLEQQVARLQDENRGLRQRLERYEASGSHHPRHNGRGGGSAAGPSGRNGGSGGGATGRKQSSSGGRGGGGPIEGRARHGHGTSTAAHSQHNQHRQAGTAAGVRRHRSPSKSFPPSSFISAAPSPVHNSPSKKPRLRCLSLTPAREAAATVDDVVKTEVSSSDDDTCPTVVGGGDGYTSSTTTDEVSSTSSPQMRPMPSPFSLKYQQQQQQQAVVFDKDDDAACDDLLMDIFSGEGEENEEFLSLLTDNVPVHQQSPSPVADGLGSLSSFVKQEIIEF